MAMGLQQQFLLIVSNKYPLMFASRVISTLVTLLLSFNVVAGLSLEKRATRTSPPANAIVVKTSGASSGEFTTVQAAVNSLPNDSSSRSIFIYPGELRRNPPHFFVEPTLLGIYQEQVTISRPGPLTVTARFIHVP
jgi:pectinesterase